MLCDHSAVVTRWTPMIFKSAKYERESTDQLSPNATTPVYTSLSSRHNHPHSYPASPDLWAHAGHYCDRRCLSKIADYGLAPWVARASFNTLQAMVKTRQVSTLCLCPLEKGCTQQPEVRLPIFKPVDQTSRTGLGPRIQEGTPGAAPRPHWVACPWSDGGVVWALCSDFICMLVPRSTFSTNVCDASRMYGATWKVTLSDGMAHWSLCRT